MKVYQRILQLFEAEGIKTIFGIPDPNFVHLFVEAEKRGWTIVTPHHELAVGFAAEGYARMTGRPAVAIATLGPGGPRHRLALRKGRPLEILATGDPAAAPAGLRPLAELLQELSWFSHPSLRPHRPGSYVLRAREGTLAGGCRGWAFTVPLADAVSAPRAVPENEGEGWPTGAVAASVCSGSKRYVVTLRPMVPGERP